MGQAKKRMMENEYNDDLIDFFKQLLEKEELSGAIEGIAKQLIDKGVDSLKGAQKPVIDSFVENYKSKIVCEKCGNGNVSQLTDYIFITENDLCPICQYDYEKLMDE